MRPVHHPDKGRVVERLDEMDIGKTLEDFVNGFSHARVEMNGIHDLNVIDSGDRFQRLGRCSQKVSETLPADVISKGRVGPGVKF